MNHELPYLVFVNKASYPIAGFAWIDEAVAWAEANYPGNYVVRSETKEQKENPVARKPREDDKRGVLT